MQVVQHLGVNEARPKEIKELMHVDFITTTHIKSHLQKYRTQLKKMGALPGAAAGNEEQRAGVGAGAGGAVGNVPSSSFVSHVKSAAGHLSPSIHMSTPTTTKQVSNNMQQAQQQTTILPPSQVPCIPIGTQTQPQTLQNMLQSRSAVVNSHLTPNVSSSSTSVGGGVVNHATMKMTTSFPDANNVPTTTPATSSSNHQHGSVDNNGDVLGSFLEQVNSLLLQHQQSTGVEQQQHVKQENGNPQQMLRNVMPNTTPMNATTTTNHTTSGGGFNYHNMTAANIPSKYNLVINNNGLDGYNQTPLSNLNNQQPPPPYQHQPPPPFNMYNPSPPSSQPSHNFETRNQEAPLDASLSFYLSLLQEMCQTDSNISRLFDQAQSNIERPRDFNLLVEGFRLGFVCGSRFTSNTVAFGSSTLNASMSPGTTTAGSNRPSVNTIIVNNNLPPPPPLSSNHHHHNHDKH